MKLTRMMLEHTPDVVRNEINALIVCTERASAIADQLVALVCRETVTHERAAILIDKFDRILEILNAE